MQRLKTNHLQLRDFTESDSNRVFDLYKLPETSQFESWEPMQSHSEASDLVKSWIDQQAQSPRRNFTLAVTQLDDPTLIGLCGLDLGFGTETDDLRTGFVGYRYFPQYWNQGFATEALKEVIRWGFLDLGLHRIHSGCSSENVASARVLEKAEMRLEGTTRKSFPIGDRWTDYLIYASASHCDDHENALSRGIGVRLDDLGFTHDWFVQSSGDIFDVRRMRIDESIS